MKDDLTAVAVEACRQELALAAVQNCALSHIDMKALLHHVHPVQQTAADHYDSICNQWPQTRVHVNGMWFAVWIVLTEMEISVNGKNAQTETKKK